MFSVNENFHRNTKALVDVYGYLTDVFECRVVVRQGDNISALLFIIFKNDFQKPDSSKFTCLSLNYHDMTVQEFLKVYVLLYADDTLFVSETSKDNQNVFNTTLT